MDKLKQVANQVIGNVEAQVVKYPFLSLGIAAFVGAVLVVSWA